MSGTRIWIVGVALVLALVLGCYLSGAILLWRLDLPVSQLGILSYGRYWWAYHDHAQYGPLIQSSGTIGFGLPVLLVLTLVRLNTPPRFCVNAPIPVVAPVSVNVPLLVIALPPKLPATFAVAPALLVSPPASVPVLVSVPALVSRPMIVPALVSVALFCTAPAIVPPLTSDSVPPLTVVSPA